MPKLFGTQVAWYRALLAPVMVPFFFLQVVWEVLSAPRPKDGK